MFRIVVLISGNGTNLQAIIDAIESGDVKAKIVAVVSNRKAAYGLVRAEKASIETVYRSLKAVRDAGGSRDDFDRDLAEMIEGYAPDMIVLAGWMHILSEAFVSRFDGRIINLHPALPGAFDGANAIARAFEAYQRGEIAETGLMVHRATAVLDRGEVLGVTRVGIEETDTLETLEERMHREEHQLLVRVIREAVEAKRT